jgi:hypothetical protein
VSQVALLVLGGITWLFAIRDPRRVPVVVPARASVDER